MPSSRLAFFSAAALSLSILIVGAAPRLVAADPAVPGKGEVVVTASPVAGSDSPKIVVRAVIEQPPKKVWQIVSECALRAGYSAASKASCGASSKLDIS